MTRTPIGKIVKAPLATGVLAFLLLVPTVLHLADPAFGQGSGSCSGYCDTIDTDPEGCTDGCDVDVAPPTPVLPGDDLTITIPDVDQGGDLDVTIDQGDLVIIDAPPLDDLADLEAYTEAIAEQPHVNAISLDGVGSDVTDLQISLVEFVPTDVPLAFADAFDGDSILDVTLANGPTTLVLKALEIELDGIDHDDFEQAAVTFRVSGAELAAFGIDPNRVRLAHFVDGEWVILRTQLVTVEQGAEDFLDVYVYSATTDSFSLFAITGKRGTPSSLPGAGGDDTRTGGSDFSVGCNYDCSTESAPTCDGYCAGYEPKPPTPEVDTTVDVPAEDIETSAVCDALAGPCTALVGRVPVDADVSVTLDVPALQATDLPALGSADPVAFEFALKKMLEQSKVTGVRFTAGLASEQASVAIQEFVPGDAAQSAILPDLQTPVQNYLVPAAVGATQTTFKVVKILEIHPVDTTASGEATIAFRLLDDELAAFGLGASDVRLLHKVDGKWVALPTTVTGHVGDVTTFEARTPSFSYFAIAGTASEAGAVSASGVNALIVTAGVIALAVVVGIAVLVTRRKK